MEWRDISWTLVFPWSSTMPYCTGRRDHFRLTELMLPITGSTAGARFGKVDLISTAQILSVPPLPLHHSTL